VHHFTLIRGDPESRVYDTREANMSFSYGPPNPPPPHPDLDVRTRGSYGDHDAIPCEFWLKCHHGKDAVVQVYELLPDAGHRFFRCPHFKVCIALWCQSI
jgi:hypothetical protein